MSESSSCLLVYIDDEHIYFVSLRKSELLLPCFISQLMTAALVFAPTHEVTVSF